MTNVLDIPARALHALLEGADEGGAGGARGQLGRLPLLLLDLRKKKMIELALLMTGLILWIHRVRKKLDPQILKFKLKKFKF